MNDEHCKTLKASKRVQIKWDTLEVIVNGTYPYPVDLERCNTPAQLLDYIFQVAGKNWCDGPLLLEMLEAFEDACQQRFGTCIQGAFCPFGRPQRVNWA